MFVPIGDNHDSRDISSRYITLIIPFNVIVNSPLHGQKFRETKSILPYKNNTFASPLTSASDFG